MTPSLVSEGRIAVTLIIPAHNEEQRLVQALKLYYPAFKAAFGEAFELLVVCNGCTDATADLALAFELEAPQTRVLVINDAVGKGGALVSGFLAARGSQVIFADADAATDVESLLGLLDLLASHDVAIGSRRVAGSHIARAQALPRRLFGAGFHYCTRFIFGLPYLDTQCGAKALRSSAAQLLAETVTERRWTFDVDLLLSARRLGLTVAEVPVRWTDVPGSQLRVVPTMVQVIGSFWRLKRKESRRVPVAALPTLVPAAVSVAVERGSEGIGAA